MAASKPVLLQQLEAFLLRELQVVGCPGDLDDSNHGDSILPRRFARLQVFRECFLRLIDDFKTYKPLLLAIKNEYEALLDLYSMQVSKIPQFEAALRTLEQETQQAVSEQKLASKMKIKEWKKLLKSTQATLAGYAAANATLTDANSRLTADLEDANAKMADVTATNQALMHSMRRQEERQKEHDSETSDLDATLQATSTKLARAQEEITELRNSIKMLEDKASRVDINADRRTIDQLTREVQELLTARAEANAQHHPAADEATFVSTCIAAFHGHGWTYLASNINTIAALVEAIVGHSSSRDKASVFLTQDEPGEVQEACPEDDDFDFFTGRGMDESVPKYLQFEGRVRNKWYSKRETQQLISHVWQQKALAEKMVKPAAAPAKSTRRISASSPSKRSMEIVPAMSIPLQQFFHTYLTKKYADRLQAVECAYNIVAALDRYQDDTECRIFQRVLEGQLPEDARVDSLQVLSKVFDAFAALDKNESELVASKRRGVVSVGGALRELQLLFPWKYDSHMAMLLRALLLEAKGQHQINYTTMLDRDRDGNLSFFCQTLCNQHIDDLFQLSQSLARALEAEEKRAGPANNGMISLDAVRQAIRKSDPSRSPQAVDNLVAECTLLPLERVGTETTTLVNATTVRSKLSTLLIKPSGKLPLEPLGKAS
ncbi:unnamed protein product [Aphanomyces euteiches]|nr:hypothetical protein AeRB84_010967 [Aphanomyces euteiches]